MTGTDPEGAALTFSISTQPQNGTVTSSGAAGTYTPNENFNGSDTFAYIASDGTLSSTAGVVSVTVTAVDDDPNTMNVSAVTDEDNAVVITLEAEEYDGDTISFSIKDNPAYGTVSLTGDKATYTPNENYYGSDSFTFEAVDYTAKKILNTATASITINPINDAPIIDNSNSTISIDMISNYYPFSFTLNASDPENNDISFEIVQQPNNGSISVDSNNLVYDSTAHSINSFGGGFGDDLFIVKAYDGEDYSAEYTFNLDISWQNHLYGRGTVISGINSNDDSGYFFLAREFIDYESLNIFKTSKDGNPLWIKKLDNINYNYGELIQSTENSLYLVSSSGASTARVIKLDDSGNELWRTDLDTSGLDVGFSLIEDNDGNIVVGTSSAESDNNRRMTIWKLDTSGNLLFKKIIDGGGSISMEARAVSISDDSSGNYYVLGTNQNKVEIRKVDNDGDYINRIIIGEGCNRCDPKIGFGRISKYNNNFIVSFVDAAVAYLHIYDEDLNPVMDTNFDVVENLGDWLNIIDHVEFNQDIYTVHNITNSKSQQAYISKFTDGGGLISQIDYGGDENDHVEFIFHDDENLIFGGDSRSFKQSNAGNHPYYWISKIDPSGNKLF